MHNKIPGTEPPKCISNFTWNEIEQRKLDDDIYSIVNTLLSLIWPSSPKSRHWTYYMCQVDAKTNSDIPELLRAWLLWSQPDLMQCNRDSDGVLNLGMVMWPSLSTWRKMLAMPFCWVSHACRSPLHDTPSRIWAFLTRKMRDDIVQAMWDQFTSVAGDHEPEDVA